MRIAKQILFFYCFTAALFITTSGIATSKSLQQLSLQLIFLPVTLYFIVTLIKKLLHKNHTQEAPKAGFRIKTTLFVFCVFLVLLLISVMQVTSHQTPIGQKVVIKKPTAPTTPVSHLSPSPQEKEQEYILIKTDEDNTKVNIREEATVSAKILEKTTNNQKYPLIKIEKKWYKILLNDGKEGYVNSEFAATVSENSE